MVGYALHQIKASLILLSSLPPEVIAILTSVLYHVFGKLLLHVCMHKQSIIYHFP